MEKKRRKPEWATDSEHGADAAHDGHHVGAVFAGEVVSGVQNVRTTATHRHKRRALSAEEAVAGIRAGDRVVLSRAITLIESRAQAHRPIAAQVLREVLPLAGNSIRIGITGVPGAGKSTFIECFGKLLCNKGHRVAVLAVDPSSSVSGGSVLGDKTRMEDLSREKNAFIRPSPSAGTLGGVAAKTREVMLLCEAAGFDVILIETVGVGQSEVEVRSMSDFFLLLQITGAGDELQGIKKGVIEMADAIVVNKADGDNARRAEVARGEYARVLHYLQPYTVGWAPQALSCSALTGAGVAEIWDLIGRFSGQMQQSGQFVKRRADQNAHWLHSLLSEAVLAQFYGQAAVCAALPQVALAVKKGQLPVVEAVERLLAAGSTQVPANG